MPKSGLPKTGALNFIIQKVNLYHFEQNDIIELFCATRLFCALCDFAACVERKISPFAFLLRIFSKEPHALWLRGYINVDEYLLAASPIYAVSHINDKVLLAHRGRASAPLHERPLSGRHGRPYSSGPSFLKACETARSWPAWQPLATRRLPSVPQAQMLVREKRNALVAERVKAQEQVPHQGCHSPLPLPRTEETGRIHL